MNIPKVLSYRIFNSTYLFANIQVHTFHSFKKYTTLTMAEDSNGVILEKVVKALCDFAQLNLAEPWDNVGLLIEPATPTYINNILLTNDLTENVMQEAIDTRSNMIVSYHPPIFAKLQRITSKTWKERIVAKCLENRIAVFSPHTSWDSVKGGVADWLSECLPIKSSSPIIPNSELPDTGAGRIVILKEPLKLNNVIEIVKKWIDIKHLKVSIARGKTLDDSISTVAVCPGSGSSVLRNVAADLYLTGEMQHHDLLDAVHCNSHVILCNHSDSERGFLKHFAPILQNRVGCSVMVSKTDVDPIITV